MGGRGLIKLRRDGDLLLFQAPPLLRSGPLDANELEMIVRGLGIQHSDIVASAWCDNGVPWRGILLKSATEVLKLTPNASLLGDIDVGVIGAMEDINTTKNINVDFEVRAFCPMDSPFEDPVTGSLNAAMAHWLIDIGLIPSSGYVVRQGTAIGRHGIVHIMRIDDNGNEAVWVGGICKTCIDGLVCFESLEC